MAGRRSTPREVDEALLEHPAVAEAVTFAMPHATLGEDVAAAIVLRPGAQATPKDIRQFAIRRVADFKVPRQVFIVKEIPKSSTGKVQRIGLAARLGLAGPAASAQTSVLPPRTPLEKKLAEFWAQILEVEQIGIHDDFFALGGDSLLAARVLTHMYQITHRRGRSRPLFRDADGCGDGAPSRDIDSGGPSATSFFGHCARIPGRSAAGLHCPGKALEAAASTAGLAFFQCPLCAPTDVVDRRGGAGAEHQ